MPVIDDKRAIHVRKASDVTQKKLKEYGLSPILARVLAARGIKEIAELDDALSNLIPYDNLKNCRKAAQLLTDAIYNQQKMLIVADYDADGATAVSYTHLTLPTTPYV